MMLIKQIPELAKCTMRVWPIPNHGDIKIQAHYKFHLILYLCRINFGIFQIYYFSKIIFQCFYVGFSVFTEKVNTFNVFHEFKLPS